MIRPVAAHPRAIVAVAACAFLAPTGHAVAQLPGSADSSVTRAAGPQLMGTPSVRYSQIRDDEGRYVSVGAVFRTDRELDANEYATIAAPNLRRAQELPDELFGGAKPSAIGERRRHCYVAEVSLLKRRSTVSDPRWRMGLRRDDQVTGRVKRVTLRRDGGDGRWPREAAERLGC